MREIKFRYALKHNVSGLILTVVYEYYEIFNGLCQTMLSEGLYKNYTVLGKDQFTGLKDNNGKEIYEGDIVLKCDPKYWREQEEEPDAGDIAFYRGGTAQVIMTKYGVQMDEIECGEWCFNGPEGRDWCESELEVIGNIHQNPELLKP